MMVLGGWWLAGLLSSGLALAQSPVPVAVGSRVRIADVGAEDAFYSSRGDVVGQVCLVSQEPLQAADGGWYRGGLVCANGVSYRFFQVKVEEPGTPSLASADVAEVRAGTSFVIRDIHADDAYFTDAKELVGRSCVAGQGFERSDGAYWGGPAFCGSDSYYFFKVAFEVTGVAPESPAVRQAVGDVDDGRFLGESVRKGTKVTIADISGEDGYAGYREMLVGRTCKVKKGKLTATGPGWFAGTLEV